MGKVIASITTVGGRLHRGAAGRARSTGWASVASASTTGSWAGPWTYADDGHDTDGMHGPDREYFDALTEGHGLPASSAGTCTTPPARGAERTRSPAR